MLSIYQGETLTFTLEGDEYGFADYKVRAAMYPSTHNSFRRDCICGDTSLVWEEIDIVDGVAVWTLTTEQSASLPIGKYAMEVALRDISTGDDIKDATIDIINVKPSYTR